MNEMNEAENNKIINYLNEGNAELNKKAAEFNMKIAELDKERAELKSKLDK